MGRFGNIFQLMSAARTRPAQNTPFTEIRFVVVDTELTGIDEKRDSIISIAALGMRGPTIQFGDCFSMLVQPKARLRAESVVIHEITPSEVLNQPDIGAALAQFLAFCGNDILIGHCLAVDLGFLDREMRRIYGHPVTNPVVDTYSLFEFLKRRMPDHPSFVSSKKEFRLYDIAKNFAIPVQGGHNALMDAFITAQLFQRFVSLLAGLGLARAGDLLRVGSPSRGGDAFRSSQEVCNL